MVIRYKKLIFVDTNDNCRAPMAELILKRKFLTNPLSIESRGLVVLFPNRLILPSSWSRRISVRMCFC